MYNITSIKVTIVVGGFITSQKSADYLFKVYGQSKNYDILHSICKELEDSSLVWELKHVHGHHDDTILWDCLSLITHLSVQVDNIAKKYVYRAHNINHCWLQCSLQDIFPCIFMGHDKI